MTPKCLRIRLFRRHRKGSEVSSSPADLFARPRPSDLPPACAAAVLSARRPPILPLLDYAIVTENCVTALQAAPLAVPRAVAVLRHFAVAAAIAAEAPQLVGAVRAQHQLQAADLEGTESAARREEGLEEREAAATEEGKEQERGPVTDAERRCGCNHCRRLRLRHRHSRFLLNGPLSFEIAPGIHYPAATGPDSFLADN